MKPGPALLGLALLLYPLLFYLLVDRAGLAVAAGLLAALALGRLLMLGGVAPRWRWLAAGSLVALLIGVVYWHSATLLKLYPVVINAALLAFGLYTLWRPPSAIERLMHSLGLPVSAAGVPYTRAVTMLWCGYFAVNGSIAAYTALVASTGVWALYNGAMSYAAAAVLFGLEYVCRGIYRRRVHERARRQGSAGTACS